MSHGIFMKGLFFVALQLVLVSMGFAQDFLYIEVQSCKLRQEPKYWAASLGELVYGTRLEKLGEQSDWIRVKAEKLPEGFVHRSAVTTRTVILSHDPSATRAAASSTEVVLAGKGFTEEVEKEYRLENPEVDYELLERALALKISDIELQEFAKTGWLLGETP